MSCRFSRCVLVVAQVLLMVSFVATARAQNDDLDDLMTGDPEPEEEVEEEEEEEADDEQGEQFPEEVERVPMSMGQQMDDDEAPPKDWTEPEPDDGDGQPQDDGTSKPIGIALLGGYGVRLDDGPNPWGGAFGLHFGYNLSGFLLGARFVYYIGETVETSVTGITGGETFDETSHSLWELGIEPGYNIVVSIVTIRPFVGLGVASVNRGDNSEVSSHVSPGLSVLFAVSEGMFVGVDGRFQYIATNQGHTGVPIFATLGLNF